MEKLGEIVKPIIRVRVKTWDEMVEQYGCACGNEIYLDQFNWHKVLEKVIPEDRIIGVVEKYNLKNILWWVICMEFHKMLLQKLLNQPLN